METITLLGLYQYDPTIFDEISLPAGLDKSVLIDTILLNGGEFEALYVNPSFIRSASRIWSIKWQKTISKWLEAINAEFNPVENFDRYEEMTITANTKADTTAKQSGSNSTTYGHKNVTETDGDTKTTGGSTAEHSVSAYDSSTYVPSEKTQNTFNNQNVNVDDTVTSTDSGSDTVTLGTRTDSGTIGESDSHQIGHLHGNIGVTEATTMIQHTIELYGMFNIYDLVADCYLKEFVLPIY